MNQEMLLSESEQEERKLTLKGYLVSPNCKFTADFEINTLSIANYFRKALDYISVTMLVGRLNLSLNSK
jgi:hypothetical protein